MIFLITLQIFLATTFFYQVLIYSYTIKIVAKGSKFVCNECGYNSFIKLGRCPDCGSFGTLQEEHFNSTNNKLSNKLKPEQKVVAYPLSQIPLGSIEKFSTGLSEVDRVLEGGIVPNSVILLGGEPGVGKSTLVIQLLKELARANHQPLLYISGEESPQQIKMRAQRLAADDNILVTTATDTLAIASLLEEIQPKLAVVDSIQVLRHPAISSTTGSISQTRESLALLTEIAKRPEGPALIVIGHVTKEGIIAGPKTLEHMVDTLLYLELADNSGIRILRATKDRFGSGQEIGLFTMTSNGLLPADELAISASFEDTAPGVSYGVVMEGSRVILVEVQALATPTQSAYPRRIAQGIDLSRFQLILAILERHLRLPVGRLDIYANLVRGIKIFDPSLDLALAAAIVSAVLEVAPKVPTIWLGELDLTGNVRTISHFERRCREGIRRGAVRIVGSSQLSDMIDIDNYIALSNIIKLGELLHPKGAL